MPFKALVEGKRVKAAPGPKIPPFEGELLRTKLIYLVLYGVYMWMTLCVKASRVAGEEEITETEKTTH